jgi:hypothetical protein
MSFQAFTTHNTNPSYQVTMDYSHSFASPAVNNYNSTEKDSILEIRRKVQAINIYVERRKRAVVRI